MKLTEHKLLHTEHDIRQFFFGSRALSGRQIVEIQKAALHILSAQGYNVNKYIKEQKR